MESQEWFNPRESTHSVRNASQTRRSLVQLLDELALVQIPKYDRPVSAGADKHLTIGANAEAVDGTSVEGKVVDELQGVSVPDCEVVSASRLENDELTLDSGILRAIV